MQQQIIIKSSEFSKYNKLRLNGYCVLWVGNGFICLIKK